MWNHTWRPEADGSSGENWLQEEAQVPKSYSVRADIWAFGQAILKSLGKFLGKFWGKSCSQDIKHQHIKSIFAQLGKKYLKSLSYAYVYKSILKKISFFLENSTYPSELHNVNKMKISLNFP